MAVLNFGVRCSSSNSGATLGINDGSMKQSHTVSQGVRTVSRKTCSKEKPGSNSSTTFSVSGEYYVKTLCCISLLIGCLFALLPTYSASARAPDDTKQYCQVLRKNWVPINEKVTASDCQRIIKAIGDQSNTVPYSQWDTYDFDTLVKTNHATSNRSNCWLWNPTLWKANGTEQGRWFVVSKSLRDTSDRQGCVAIIQAIARIQHQPYTYGGWQDDHFFFNSSYEEQPYGGSAVDVGYGE